MQSYYIWFISGSDATPKVEKIMPTHAAAQNWVRSQGWLRGFYRVTMGNNPPVKPADGWAFPTMI